MNAQHSTTDARVGDRLEARGVHGQSVRSGEVLELLGTPGHEHYRVRWEDGHESIIYPADGVSIVPKSRRSKGAR